MRPLFSTLILLTMLIIVACSGCTPYIYGVPQPQWDHMTESQREEAIRGHNERERIREQARQAEAVRQAREAERRAAELKRQEALQQQRVAGIYAGTAGQIGDLIQVTISGGQMRVIWGHQNYQPIAFRIANGETRRVEVVAVSSRYVKPDRAELLVRYQDGLLLIDGADDSWDRAVRLPVDPSWRHGGSRVVTTKSNLDLRNVTIGVKVVPHLQHYHGR